MQRWHKPTEGAQKINEKNGISCLGIMFYSQNSQIFGQKIIKVPSCISKIGILEKTRF